jgi:primary-amine oxidase
LEEVALVPAPGEGSNAFTARQRWIDHEGSISARLAPSGLSRWKVVNRAVKNSVGHFNGYMIHGDPLPPLLPGLRAPIHERASFVHPQLWVSRYHDGELHASGTFGACAAKPSGLPQFTKSRESINQDDLVLWYNLGTSHMPRPEEWPVMPAAHIGFRLSPDGFLDRNPTVQLSTRGK